MSALVALQYQTTFEGALDESGLRALAENPAIRILFGTPVALDDAGGFTVWRTGMPLLVLAGVWILLAGTRITRGEEDAGRIDLLLAGRVSMVGLIARCLIAIGGASVVISAAVGVASSPPARTPPAPRSTPSQSLGSRSPSAVAPCSHPRSCRRALPQWASALASWAWLCWCACLPTVCRNWPGRHGRHRSDSPHARRRTPTTGSARCSSCSAFAIAFGLAALWRRGTGMWAAG